MIIHVNNDEYTLNADVSFPNLEMGDTSSLYNYICYKITNNNWKDLICDRMARDYTGRITHIYVTALS